MNVVFDELVREPWVAGTLDSVQGRKKLSLT